MSSEDYPSPFDINPLHLALGMALVLFLAIATHTYISGAGNDIYQWLAEKYFKAAAPAQRAALQKAGGTAAEGFL